ncbi:MAG TPA: ATP-binding protein [Streptosporangiaceae bacterium]|nr:ATP-binding protein [Streptosporangiaceae bacterium]
MSSLGVPGDGERSPDAGEARPGYTAVGRAVREPAARLALAAEQAAARWPLGRIAAVAVAGMALFSIAAIVVGGVALAGLATARNRVENVLDPAGLASRQLAYSLVNQETGVRGYLLSANPSFLAPYYSGQAIQVRQVSELRRLTAGLPAAHAELVLLQARVNLWRAQYAVPSIAQVRKVGKPVVSPDIATGKALFDSLRQPLYALEADIGKARHQAAATLNSSAGTLDTACITIAVLLLLIVAAVAVGLQAVAIRPLTRLAGEAQEVAAGDFGHEVTPNGPREAANLAVAVNRMRERILSELSAVQTANSALRTRAQDLERSNAELEQFAYVASHDLQEPLRKVASFCQLLQRRYVGQLDARADQYIEYAVDGAKRMQVLIDDLLAFSRVGRLDREPALISCASAVSAARTNLAAEVRKSGAVIETADLPVVRAEFSLITSLFQNLIGNAIKFRSQEPPRIVISAQRLEAFWLFTVADNGIGIEPEYADKIFVIFQRLHDRATYTGTGIGLAMCRKIVEYYGGKIWLETTASPGATFCFTLPIPPEGEETG